MIRLIMAIILCIVGLKGQSQDLSYGLEINDFDLHPMQAIDKPEYLGSIIDPSFWNYDKKNY